MATKSKTQGEQSAASSPPAGDAQEQWLRPWTDEDDLSDWETVEMDPQQPRGPRGSIFAVDLNAEQTAWLYRRSREAGVSPIDYLIKLVDDARATEA